MSARPEDHTGPAEQLAGLVVNEKWAILERLARDGGDTGSTRSSCYRAVSLDGRHAFVKAYDFRRDDIGGDTEKLQRILSEFNNEKRIHEHCRDRKLSRVTQIYDHGVVVVGGQGVHFLVCEYAERSLRNYHPPGEESVPACERLIALKKIASALIQLHTAGVAHQDVKPSNAVYFDDDRIKITDLGSASCIHLPAPPHDDDPYVGQPNYAPYELLYNTGTTGNWHRRRYGCDVFLLGNLIFTSFVGHSLTPLAMHAIGDKLWPTAFSDTYDEVLPDLISAHALIIPAFLGECVPDSIAAQLIHLVSSLCHPDPGKRGLSTASPGSTNSFALHRCVGVLNTLATRARLNDLRQR